MSNVVYSIIDILGEFMEDPGDSVHGTWLGRMLNVNQIANLIPVLNQQDLEVAKEEDCVFLFDLDFLPKNSVYSAFLRRRNQVDSVASRSAFVSDYSDSNPVVVVSDDSPQDYLARYAPLKGEAIHIPRPYKRAKLVESIEQFFLIILVLLFSFKL